MAYRAFQKITADATVKTLADAITNKHSRAWVAVEGAAIRSKTDGGNPSATDGIPWPPGSYVELESQDEVNNFKFIRRDGADATLQVESWGVL